MTLILSALLATLAFAVNPSIVGAAALFLIVILVWLGGRERQVINPYYLFLLTPISLLLYPNSDKSLYLPSIDVGVQFVIIGAVFAYLAGLLSFGGIGRRYTERPSAAYSFWIILALGLFPHVAGVITTGIPLFAGDVNAARETYNLPVIGQFMIFLPVSMLIAFRRRDRSLVFLSLALNAFFSAIMVSRFSIAFSALFFFFGYFRYDGRSLLGIRPLHLIALTAVSVPFLFEAVFSAREGASQTVYAWQREINFGLSLLDRHSEYLLLPYIYLTTPWSNFSYIFEVQPDLTLGARSIYSLASFFQVEQLLQLEPRPIRNSTFNTHAFPADFLMDFGIFGTVVMSFLTAILVKWSYVSAQRGSDVLQEGIWVSIGLASSLLFFSNHFTGLSYPLVSLILFQIYRVLSRLARAHRLPKIASPASRP